MDVQQVMAIIDKNKANMSSDDYLKICNGLMKINEKTTTYSITYLHISYFSKMDGNRMVIERFTEKRVNTNINIDCDFSFEEIEKRLDHFGVIPVSICNNKIISVCGCEKKSRVISEDEDNEYATNIFLEYDEHILLNIKKN